MSSPRQFLLFSTYESAKAADTSVCDLLRVRDGNKGSRWAGVSIRNDGKFGVFWDTPCIAVFGPPQNNVLDTEILSQDGQSNWTDYTPPPPPNEA